VGIEDHLKAHHSVGLRPAVYRHLVEDAKMAVERSQGSIVPEGD
jgi:hypothetical protein